MTREDTGTIKLKSPGGTTNSLNNALFGVGPPTIEISAILRIQQYCINVHQYRKRIIVSLVVCIVKMRSVNGKPFYGMSYLADSRFSGLRHKQAHARMNTLAQYRTHTKNTHTRTYARTHSHTHTYALMYAYANTHTHARTHTHVRAHTQINSSTHTN